MTAYVTTVLRALSALFLLSGIAVAQDPLPGDWSVDGTLYPKAYGVLSDEHLMFPVDMSDWPVRIDGSHQLFVDDYLIASKNGVEREVHELRKHHANPFLVPDRPWEGPSGILFPIVRRAFFMPSDKFSKFDEASSWMVIPLVLTAALSLFLGLFPERAFHLYHLASDVVSSVMSGGGL